MEENCDTSIVVQNEPQNLPLVDIDSALAYWKNYQELTEKLLDPSDYHIKGSTKFKKKSAWRKYATFMNISCETLSEEITRTEDGRIITAKYEVKATAPNGRFETGLGLCSIWDKAHEGDKIDNYGKITCKGPCDGRKHFDKPEHDIPSTAHTRAKNRAISDLIGAGEVSAEEIDFTKSNGNTKKKPVMKTRGKPTPKDKPESTPKGIDPEKTQDAEITEKKGSNPGGITSKTPQIPLSELVAPCSKEFGHVIDSKGNKAEKLTPNWFKTESKVFYDAGNIPKKEYEAILKVVEEYEKSDK